MKRLLPLAAIIWAYLLSTNTLAAGDAEIVRAFVHEDTLYTYIQTETITAPITKVEAKIGVQTFQSIGRLETVRQAQSPVTYLLLIDNSTSMTIFRNDITAFTERLAQSGGENTQFFLSTFGETFTVLSDGKSTGDIASKIAGVTFHEKASRLHDGICQALDWLEALPRQGNELRVLLVLSDAVLYDPNGGIDYETILERVNCSDIVLHTVGFGKNADALKKLRLLAEASGGIHQIVGGQNLAIESAKQIDQVNTNLMVTGFALFNCETFGKDVPFSITFFSESEILCKGKSSVSIPYIDEMSSNAEKQVSTQIAPVINKDHASSHLNQLPILMIVFAVIFVTLATVIIYTLFKQKRSM